MSRRLRIQAKPSLKVVSKKLATEEELPVVQVVSENKKASSYDHVHAIDGQSLGQNTLPQNNTSKAAVMSCNEDDDLDILSVSLNKDSVLSAPEPSKNVDRSSELFSTDRETILSSSEPPEFRQPISCDELSSETVAVVSAEDVKSTSAPILSALLASPSKYRSRLHVKPNIPNDANKVIQTTTDQSTKPTTVYSNHFAVVSLHLN